MRTQLYGILNDDAKAWWYHVKLRGDGDVIEARRRERRSILDKVSSLREALDNGGFLSIGRGGWSLNMSRHHRLSGYDRDVNFPIAQACMLLGIPILDSTTIPDERILETIRMPMPAPEGEADAEPEGGYHSLSLAPFSVVARMYAAIGATVYNIEL